MRDHKKELKELEEITMKKLTELRQIVQLQSMNGNWDQDQYMHGLCNGLIIALAIFENETPNFLDAPEGGYLKEKEIKGSNFAKKVMDLGDMGDDFKARL